MRIVAAYFLLILLSLIWSCTSNSSISSLDADNDGFKTDTDCDDSDPNIYPGATEICEDGIDSDCTDGDLVCQACEHGAVAERCRCGQSVVDSDYCCNQAISSSTCPEPDLCQGVTCSGHGSCTVVDGNAACECETGWEPADLECIEMSGWMSKQEFSNKEGEHQLGPNNHGLVSINFDVTPLYNQSDGVIGYTAHDRQISSYQDLNILVRMFADGFWDARNGADYSAESQLAYAANQDYHVRLAIDLSQKTYSVWITPSGGTEVQLAADYAFRSDANNTIDNIGKVFLVSDNGDDRFLVKNHSVDSTPVCPQGSISSSCYCQDGVYDSGSCCLGQYFIENQCPVDCGQGEVNAVCFCGSIVVDDGWCCNNVPRSSACDTEQVLAFPGAQGFGAKVTGGRGGEVIKVTNKNTTGPGSLQEALDHVGPRIIVFSVSGVITGDFTISQPDVTIAGQTAPGAGITIAGTLYTPYCDRDVKNIILRHVRIRHLCSDGSLIQCDAMQFSCASQFIFDHVSISWGIDETLDLYSGADYFTIQDSTIEDPCLGHPEHNGQHNYGLLNGPGGGHGSVIRTAFLNSKSRNPALADGPYEVINTVVYNHREGLVHHNPASGDYNIIGNYYKIGVDLGKPFYFYPDEPFASPTNPSYYFADNFIDDGPNPFGPFDDPWNTPHALLGALEMAADETHKSSQAHDYTNDEAYVAPSILDSSQAFSVVLTKAGAFPRDVVTLAVVNHAQNRSAEWGCPQRGDDLMQGLTETQAPTDGDEDGMPDTWEQTHGLIPDNGSDHSTIMPSGYTAIEVYINELADLLVGL